MLDIYKFSRVWENVEPWLVYADKPIFELHNHISRLIFWNASFFLAFNTCKEKNKVCYKVLLF